MIVGEIRIEKVDGFFYWEIGLQLPSSPREDTTFRGKWRHRAERTALLSARVWFDRLGLVRREDLP